MGEIERFCAFYIFIYIFLPFYESHPYGLYGWIIMHDSSNHMEFYKNVPVGVKLSKI